MWGDVRCREQSGEVWLEGAECTDGGWRGGEQEGGGREGAGGDRRDDSGGTEGGWAGRYWVIKIIFGFVCYENLGELYYQHGYLDYHRMTEHNESNNFSDEI